MLSDVGNNRSNNEDFCGHLVEAPDAVVFAVADGVGGYEGGEVASKMAVEITLQAYRESPREWGAEQAASSRGAECQYRGLQLRLHGPGTCAGWRPR